MMCLKMSTRGFEKGRTMTGHYPNLKVAGAPVTFIIMEILI